jgi:hypothetical protein
MHVVRLILSTPVLNVLAEIGFGFLLPRHQTLQEAGGEGAQVSRIH